MSMESSKSFLYMELFESIIFISNKITELYNELAIEESNNERYSKKYDLILSNIYSFNNIEKELLKKVISDSSILFLFKEYIDRSKCQRLKNKLYTDFELLEKILNATLNEKYDNMLEEGSISITRPEFLESEYQKSKINVLLPSIFNLMEKKKYIKVLENYISTTEDKEKKHYLIDELYTTLSCSEALESWFFSVGDNIDCLLIDIDELNSYGIGISDEYYDNLKRIHFTSLIDKFIKFIMEEDIDNEGIKTIYETNLIAMIMNLDVKSLNGSYKIFMNEAISSDFDKKKVDFVNDAFFKSTVLSKKIR